MDWTDILFLAFQDRTIEDIEYERGRLTRLMEAGEDVVLQTDMAAVLRNSANPKAEYHFLVLPKVDIINVTAVSQCTSNVNLI